jgi:aldose 1-epimerase
VPALPPGSAPSVESRPFGTLPDGTAVDLFAIRNAGIELSALTYGGIVTSLRVPDRDGRSADVVLGFDRLEPYTTNSAYFGALVGRCANRIAYGRFRLDGIPHQLATNDGPNHLHGGINGFSRRLWTAAPITRENAAGISFTRTSPAGEDHYPGTLLVQVSYLVTSDSEVILRYAATTDAPTLVNLTQHTYFNLAGESSVSVLDHELTINADHYTPVGPTLIPTGAIATVAGTAFDFRRPGRIGDLSDHSDPQLRTAGGFDHNFVLARSTRGLTLAAILRDPESGRTLHVLTTQPGLQFYGGHLLDGSCMGAHDRRFSSHTGLCLETQHFPDAPNHTQFPSITLRHGQTYSSTTIWRFDAG